MQTKNGNQEKICKEFFPNCGTCSRFSKCFPNNGLHDEASELALLTHGINNENNWIRPKETR